MSFCGYIYFFVAHMTHIKQQCQHYKIYLSSLFIHAIGKQIITKPCRQIKCIESIHFNRPNFNTFNTLKYLQTKQSITLQLQFLLVLRCRISLIQAMLLSNVLYSCKLALRYCKKISDSALKVYSTKYVSLFCSRTLKVVYKWKKMRKRSIIQSCVHNLLIQSKQRKL